MTYMKKYLLLLAISSFVASAYAQQLGLPYEYGFEEPDTLQEFQHWVLNPGSDPQNDSIDKWCVGTAIHSDGQRALYISNDGGETTHCGALTSGGTNKKIVQFAYRDVQLPDGNYYISFDWICPSMKLYAGYVQFTDSANAQGSVAPDIKQYINTDEMPNSFISRVGPNTGADTWHNDYFTMRVTNPSGGHQRWYRLYFAFVNTHRDSCQTGISCAVDNLQILKDGCQAPYNFEGDVQDCDHVVFTWRGDAGRYQIQYRSVGTESWRNRMVNGGEMSYTFESMKEGNYDFRIRGICFEKDEFGNNTDTIYSPYVYLSNFTVFCPELHCVNYLALNDTNICRCTYGKSEYSGGYRYADSTNVAFSQKGVVDFGWESINSRHTICWDTLATDERTNNQLRMVPSGYTASVRLGNWDYGNGTEAITYDYLVDSDNSILLVNYALVLEDPSHGSNDQPRFVIRIADENGTVIDPDCGVVDLNPNDPAGWNRTGEAVWKDWTTLGLNLDNYVGKRLKIQFINYDCFLGGHYGYAYFTVDCATARIKNTSCGTQQSMTVIAPEGFYYEWRPSGLPHSIPPTFTTRSVDIKNTDPTSWVCTLTSTEKSNCKFDLEVNTTARYPQAEYSLVYEPEDCQNRYRVYNNSYIWTNEDGVRHEHRDEVCDEYEWDFGIGEEGLTNEANPGYIYFPEEGGSFHVTLAAMIGAGEGSCRSEIDTVIIVPKIGETNIDTTVTICLGSYYDFHGVPRFLEEPGEADYVFQGKDPVTGCMSNDKLHLIVVPNSTTLLSDTTVCYGESVSHGGYTRSTTGDLTYILPNMFGCDSIVVQHVEVLPEIAPEITWQDIDEEHEFASIKVVFPDDTTIAYFTFEGKQYNSSTELTELTGGNYNLVFYNDFGCSITQEVKLKAGCLRNMIFQRWNDVLSLKNADYNGGLVFRSYQWCRDGEPIEGAVKSYYYQEGGLTAGAEYTCRVVIEDGSENGTEDETCAYIPDLTLGAPSLSPTLLTDGDILTVSVPEEAQLTCYTAMGVRVFDTALQSGDNYLQTSLAKGVYVMIIRLSDGERQYRVIRN